MKKYRVLGIVSLLLSSLMAIAQENEDADAHTGATQLKKSTFQKFFSRLTIGGYGEAVMTRNFYSDHFNRYAYPDAHSDDESHGRVDLPHVVLNIGYDFGRQWTMGMEIEFEHGGTESAVEMDADEMGEYEAETEKGGEVALEQFWIQKSFCPMLNLRAGEMVVPVGATNYHHLPTEFFTVYRPEGESTLFPCTWHQVGISVWGGNDHWRYEAQLLPGLESDRFGAECFVHYGATSSYEFTISNTYAGVLRIDNFSVPNLRLSASGYIGNSFKNTLRKAGSAYDDVKGTLKILTFDFAYDNNYIIARGNYDVATLSDAQRINKYNNAFPKHTSQDGQPSKHQPVGEKALCYGAELGFNFFALSNALTTNNQRLILFGRYEYQNSMVEGANKATYEWTKRNRYALGINYFPMKEIVVKAEYSYRNFKSSFNDEPSISLSIAYSGMFL